MEASVQGSRVAGGGSRDCAGWQEVVSLPRHNGASVRPTNGYLGHPPTITPTKLLNSQPKFGTKSGAKSRANLPPVLEAR